MARRVLLALVAVPRQIVVVVRSAAGRGSGFARSSIGLPLALLVNVAWLRAGSRADLAELRVEGYSVGRTVPTFGEERLALGKPVWTES